MNMLCLIYMWNSIPEPISLPYFYALPYLFFFIPHNLTIHVFFFRISNFRAHTDYLSIVQFVFECLFFRSRVNWVSLGNFCITYTYVAIVVVVYLDVRVYSLGLLLVVGGPEIGRAHV